MPKMLVGVPKSLLATALAMTGLASALPMPASAQTITGVEKVTGEPSATASTSPKSSVALCPLGKQILGGGGWAFSVSATNGERADLDTAGAEHLDCCKGPEMAGL